MFKPLQEGVDSEVTMAVEGWIDPVVKVLSKDRQEEAEDPSQALSNPENRLVSWARIDRAFILNIFKIFFRFNILR